MMPAIPMDDIQPVLDKIDDICQSLGNSWGEGNLRGAMKELKIHFLQRNIEGAFCTDLDFICVEWKDGSPTILAIIEIKKHGRPLRDWQRTVYQQIADALQVPFYLLEVSENLTKFWITDTSTEERTGPLTFEQFGRWFRSLFNPSITFYADDREKSTMEMI